MTVIHTLERTAITCPHCGGDRVYFMVDTEYVSPFDWFRCDRCRQVFTQSLHRDNPRWLAQELEYARRGGPASRPSAGR
jgi:hypothetical protein